MIETAIVGNTRNQSVFKINTTLLTNEEDLTSILTANQTDLANPTNLTNLEDLRSDSSNLSNKILFIRFNQSPFKMMKNAFYFFLQAFSFPRYLNFCLDFLVM